jgi:hypothetical protein
MFRLDRSVREYLALVALGVGFRLLATSTHAEIRPGSPLPRPAHPHLVTVGLSRLVGLIGHLSEAAVIPSEERAFGSTQRAGAR